MRDVADISGRDVGLLVLLGVIWGVSFPFISLGLDPAAPAFSPIFFAALRFDIAGATLLAFAAWRLRRAKASLVPRGGRQWLAVAIGSTLNIAAYHAFVFVGQPATNAAIAAIIVGLNPVLTTAFARIVLPTERLDGRGLAGLALGLVGIVVLATTKGGDVFDAQGIGELLVFTAIVSFAFGSTLLKRTGHAMHALVFAAWQMLGGAVVLHGLAFALEGGGFATWSPIGLVSLAYVAFAASTVGFALYFTLLERIGPIRANLVSYVAPVFSTVVVMAAPLVGAPIPGAPFRLTALVSFGLIAGGFWLVAGKR